MITSLDVNLTVDEKEWFGERMYESITGRIMMPSYLYKKFKKITGLNKASNMCIKCYLIDEVYNKSTFIIK